MHRAWVLAIAGLAGLIAAVAVSNVIHRRWNANAEMILMDKWSDGSRSYSMEYHSGPDQLDKSEVSVDIADKTGWAVTGCTVTADLTMPAMSMPGNVVVLREQDPGSYAGNVRYTMAGDWNVKVRIVKSGKVISTRNLSVSVH